MHSRALIAACVAGTVAFAAYTRTMLRGVDLGDTGSFQSAMIAQAVPAREAYPLYHALGRPFVRAVAPAQPATGLNLFSAVSAAMAIAVLTYLAAWLTTSWPAALTAGLLFAFSYTWWHQAIIAEVYTLHLLLVGGCLLALRAYQVRPMTSRLVLFFLTYAVSFGNHLSMILLLAPFTLFLLVVTNPPRDLVRPRIIALAIFIACLGALQYLPQLLTLVHAVGAPSSTRDVVAAFWFDVTKADWRESMLLALGKGQLPDHLAMAWFDARQQFGTAGLLFAAVGVVRLWSNNRPWALLLISALAINVAFAVTYNVGDPHVFFLPGHYCTALLGACALIPVASPAARLRIVGIAAVVAALTYSVWRGYDTWPAADRHADMRAERFMDRITLGLDERNAVLVTEMDWQLQNALSYTTRTARRDVAWLPLSEVMLHFPFFVDDNHAAGRDVVLTAEAAERVEASLGPLFPIAPDFAVPVVDLETVIDSIPRGALYVLATLAPTRTARFDADLITRAIQSLAPGTPWQRETYEVFIGRPGQLPIWHRAARRPFRDRIRIGSTALDVRMDAWLPTETFRRGGFGHVIRDHRHLIALERGFNLIWLEGDTVSQPVYAGGLYEPQPRFRIPANATHFARSR